MKVRVSGQAAKAVFWEDDRVWCLPLDAVEPRPCSESDVPYLLLEATDVQVLEFDSRQQVVDALELAWPQDRALHLTLILLDPDSESNDRQDAAGFLDAFFKNPAVREFVANRLYAFELPAKADLVGAIVQSDAASANGVTDFLEDVGGTQSKSGNINLPSTLCRRCFSVTTRPATASES